MCTKCGSGGSIREPLFTRPRPRSPDGAVTALGHEERFPPSSLNGSCRFSQGTFAGTHGNGRDAPMH